MATETLAQVPGISILSGIVPYMPVLAWIAWLLNAIGYAVPWIEWFARR
ncbi:MAG: hypothetical protein M1294_06230 [Firmicutes bacterium]|nr:hypothetical protein [Bacillota bacterium]